MKKELGIFILLVVLCVITSALNPKFISPVNLCNMANLIGMFGIFSIGVGMVIITGGIDLSVGSIFALDGVLLAMMLREWNWSWPIALAAILAFTMLLGLIHALLVTKARMQPFIVTLCGLMLYRGLARFISGDTTKGFGDSQGFETLKWLASGRLLRSVKTEMVNGFPVDHVLFEGIPVAFIALIIVGVIMWIVLHRSIYGRHLFAVGRNEQAARYSGICSRLVTGSAYVISGLLTGISAVMFAFYTNSVSGSTHGNSYELYGVAAAVLGGCSLVGGEGSIVGIIIGAALLQVLQNLVNLLGIPSSLNFAVVGAVVLLGVLADQLIKGRRDKKLPKAA